VETVRDLASALAVVRREGILPLTPTAGFSSFVEAVAGERPKGSWWGHPKGHLIFELCNALDDSGDVLFLKLLKGKVTLVHRDVWPFLFRYATDPGRIAAARRKLSEDARSLLTSLHRTGELRLDEHARRHELATKDGRKRLKKGREALERSLLCLSSEVHTGSGAHALVLRMWERWATTSLVDAAKGLRFDEAEAALRDACKGALP
jgi:hypothetical protein